LQLPKTGKNEGNSGKGLKSGKVMGIFEASRFYAAAAADGERYDN